MFAGLRDKDNRRERAAAKADPRAHRLSRLFENPSYRVIKAGKTQYGDDIGFAYSCHPNAAGYFLSWREVVGEEGEGRRDLHVSHLKRKVAKQFAADCAKARKAYVADRVRNQHDRDPERADDPRARTRPG